MKQDRILTIFSFRDGDHQTVKKRERVVATIVLQCSTLRAISMKGNNNMTTMLEVAKRAGVSKATVSRVLSGNGYVSRETKDRVFQAIEESGYRPNLLARNGDQTHPDAGTGGDQHPVSRRLF